MLEQLCLKSKNLIPKNVKVDVLIDNCESLEHNSALLIDSNSCDTVIDSFGLCSVENPDKLLSEIKRVCKPGFYKFLFLLYFSYILNYYRRVNIFD